MTSGYIDYTDTSIYSPMYGHTLLIDDTYYSSPHSAIEDGYDIDDVIMQYVYTYRDIYYPYRNYTFRGMYSDYLNRAIQSILVSRVEPSSVGKYIYLLDSVDVVLPMGIPVLRNSYLLTHIIDNVYLQSNLLDVVEQYHVHIIDDILLYIGTHGMFLLLDSPDQDISSILDRIYQSR